MLGESLYINLIWACIQMKSHISTKCAMALQSRLPYSLSNNPNVATDGFSQRPTKVSKGACVQEPFLICCLLPEEGNTALQIELELFPVFAEPRASPGTTRTSATGPEARESPTTGRKNMGWDALLPSLRLPPTHTQPACREAERQQLLPGLPVLYVQNKYC